MRRVCRIAIVANNHGKVRKMNKPMHLWIDQYGQREWARTVKELREKCGGGRVAKMYCDMKDGRTVQTGYVIGRRWFNRFAPVEKAA